MGVFLNMAMYFGNEESRERLLLEGRSWLGTPFFKRSKAKGVGGGVDCVNLAQIIYYNIGVIDEIKDMPEYNLDWHFHQEDSLLERIFKEMYPNEFVEIDISDGLMVGDLMLFNPMGACIHHCGILYRDNWVLHAMVERGVIETHISTSERAFTLEKVFRPIKL
ncbi:C40 family peptidase [Puniceicoccaceae bacterium K14]|nr:C40 family peptidase [Puniceicoccaceae bacterium K14]